MTKHGEKQLLLDFEAGSRPPVELMSPQDIFANASQDLLSRLKECSVIERKAVGIHAGPLSEWVCMWANTPSQGGLIAIGIEDDGTFSGCLSAEQSHVNGLEKAGHIHCPDAKYEYKRVPIKNASGSADYVLLLFVDHRSDKVAETTKGEAFIRRGDSKFKLRESEKHELAIDKGQTSFEQEPCNLRFPDDFSMEAISRFSAQVKAKKELRTEYTPEQVLANRRLGRIQGGKFIPNIACALLFANNPQDVVPGCVIRFQRLEGTERLSGEHRNVVKDVPIEGTVPELIVEADRVIASQIRDFSQLGKDGKFFVKPEYPRSAWYEAIVNACVHRSYSLRNMNIFIRMFDDRLEIESPGPFPPLVTPDNIYDVHHRRNYFLMDAMLYLDFVKCENEGTRRMRDEMLSMGLPAPEFAQKEVGSAIVRVTLRNNRNQRREWMDKDASHVVGEALFSRLTDAEKRCINHVAEYGYIKAVEATRLIGAKTWHGGKRVLDGLAEQGILEYHSRYPRDPKANYTLKQGAPPDRQAQSPPTPRKTF